jgi:hypothetical protein
MATSDVEVPTWIRPVLGLVRGRFVARFVDLAGRDDARDVLPVAGERRITDPHVTPREAARVRELIADQGPASR